MQTPDSAGPCHRAGRFRFQCVTQLLAEGRITKLTRELALQAQLVARSDSGWLLQVASASLAHEQHVQRLAAVLQEAAACPGLQVQVGAVHDTPQLRNQQLAQARQRRAEEIVARGCPGAVFADAVGASIVPGSIRPLEGLHRGSILSASLARQVRNRGTIACFDFLPRKEIAPCSTKDKLPV